MIGIGERSEKFEGLTDQFSIILATQFGLNERNSIAWFCGSIFEGLGNQGSDFDIYIVSDEDTLVPTGYCNSVTINHDGRLTDLKVIRTTELKALSDRIQAWKQGDRSPRSAMEFDYAELLLIHRIFNGQSILAPQKLNHYRAVIGFETPALLKCKQARHLMMHYQLDIAGMLKSDDWISVLIPCQNMFDRAMDGYLASIDVTNPNPKWRSRLLNDIAGQPFLEWLAGNDGAETVLEWYHRFRAAPSAFNREQYISYALNLVDVSRKMMVIAEYQIGSSHLWPGPKKPSNKNKTHNHPVSNLSPETAIRLFADKIEIFDMLRREQIVYIDYDMLMAVIYPDNLEETRIVRASVAKLNALIQSFNLSYTEPVSNEVIRKLLASSED